MNKNILLGICALGSFGLSYAQNQDPQPVQLDEAVITDSRFALKRENSGKTVIKISKTTIERNQGRTVSELINAQTGIEINGSRSNAGQNQGVYVRGGNNRQVLVLIDGVQTGDPSRLDGAYDFNLLDLSQIESIEIIKGAASTLYGSAAATAVINITTKKASKKTISSTFASSLGTNQPANDQNYNIADFKNSAAFSGTANKFQYRATFSQQYDDGLSAVATEANEKDPFSKYALNLNLGYQFTPLFSIKAYANYTDMDSAYDDPSLQDADNHASSQQARFGLSSTFAYNKQGSLHLNAAYAKYDRAYQSAFPSMNTSKSYVLDLYNKYAFDKQFYTILGLNAIKNETTFEEVARFDNIDPYANVVFVSDFGLQINTGARLNIHNLYGNHLTYNINPSYVFKQGDGQYVKLFGSYSTSFIAPSLSQLFGPYGANENLSPESDRTLEGGLEFKHSSRFRASALYFNRNEKDKIIYNSQFAYANTDESIKTQGVEVELQVMPLKSLEVNANYTFLENKSESLYKIPKHKVNASLGYKISKTAFASLNYQYTGDRTDQYFKFGEPLQFPQLKAFSVFDLYASKFIVDKNLKIFAAIDNIFNADYQEIFGYVTKGRNVRIGFLLKL